MVDDSCCRYSGLQLRLKCILQHPKPEAASLMSASPPTASDHEVSLWGLQISVAAGLLKAFFILFYDSLSSVFVKE